MERLQATEEIWWVTRETARHKQEPPVKTSGSARTKPDNGHKPEVKAEEPLETRKNKPDTKNVLP